MNKFRCLPVLILVAFTLVACRGGKPTRDAVGSQASTSITLQATKDFPVLDVEGFVPAVRQEKRKVLSVNASKYKDEFAAVRGTFPGETGRYDVQISTLKEFDGESTYRIRVDGKLVGTYQNPRTDKAGDFSPSDTTFQRVRVKKNAIIQVEFNSHSNGLIPEGNSTAYSRGRWSSLVFIPVE
ncbi:MAG: hypothetical protein AAF804_21600 [Bacteroidota bacterium]